MILDKIYNYFFKTIDAMDNTKKDIVAVIYVGFITGIGAGIITGLVAGLVAGLGAGIGAGIIAGIGVGIIAGIGAGIIAGIGVGIVAGIGAGIGVGIGAGIGVGLSGFIVASPAINTWFGLFLFTVFLAEVLFLKLDTKTPPENKSKIIFTLERKIIAFAESIVIIGSVVGITTSLKRIAPHLICGLDAHGTTILNVVRWGTAIILVIYGYIWLNSLKYRGKDE